MRENVPVVGYENVADDSVACSRHPSRFQTLVVIPLTPADSLQKARKRGFEYDKVQTCEI